MRWLLLLGVWGLYSSFGLVGSCLAPLVPLVERDLGISHSAMGSVLGAWQLVYMIVAIPCGILLDRLGSRWALTIGIALIALSALARSFADDLSTLVFSVMLFGVGGPLISAGSPKVVTEWFQGSDRGLAMGIYAMGPAIGAALTLILTHAVLLPWLGDWRIVMRLWAGVCVASGIVWLVVTSFPSFRAAEAQRRGAGAPPQLSAMRELVALRDVRLLLGLGAGTFLISHGLGSWLPEILHSRGMASVEAGYWSAIPTCVGIGASLMIPRLATPTRRYGILFALVSLTALATLFLQLEARPALLVGLLLQGTAATVLTTILVLTLLEVPGIGAHRAGIASGLFFSASQIGGVLGPPGPGGPLRSFGRLRDGSRLPHAHRPCRHARHRANSSERRDESRVLAIRHQDHECTAYTGMIRCGIRRRIIRRSPDRPLGAAQTGVGLSHRARRRRPSAEKKLATSPGSRPLPRRRIFR